MSFDKIFDLTAGVYFIFYNVIICQQLPWMLPRPAASGTVLRGRFRYMVVLRIYVFADHPPSTSPRILLLGIFPYSVSLHFFFAVASLFFEHTEFDWWPRWRILEPGIGRFREFESPRVHTRKKSYNRDFFVVHKLTCGKRESVS